MKRKSLHLFLSAACILSLAQPSLAAEAKKSAAAAPMASTGTTDSASAPVNAGSAPMSAPTTAAPTEITHKNEATTPTHELPELDWSFEGPFGTYDRAALQRGFLVYKNVCSACHGLQKMYYRHLAGLGYSEGQIKTIASDVTVSDGPNDEGEMFERPGRPSDKFKLPFPNDKAAMFANNGALPPDLSLIVKARHGGPNYVYGVLTGYTNPPADFKLLPNQHYNKAKDGHIIAMPPPLSDGAVAYEDGSPQTVDQYAKDVTQFLTWAAEPEMEQRKQMGRKVVLFLVIFAGIMYAVKRKIWESAH